MDPQPACRVDTYRNLAWHRIPFFSADDAIIYVNDFWKNLNDFRFIIPAGFLFSTRLPVRLLKKIRGSVPEIFVYLAIFWSSVYCIYVGSNDPFLYFRF